MYNNIISIPIDYTFNKVIYNFTLNTTLNLIKYKKDFIPSIITI